MAATATVVSAAVDPMPVRGSSADGDGAVDAGPAPGVVTAVVGAGGAVVVVPSGTVVVVVSGTVVVVVSPPADAKSMGKTTDAPPGSDTAT
jgi:hypothetical protein